MSKNKKRKKHLRQEAHKIKSYLVEEDHTARLGQAQQETQVKTPKIELEYVDHTPEGILFLKLIQEKLGAKLSVDDYHFHYFLADNDTFVGVVECQIYDDMETVEITSALFNMEMREVGLATISEALGEAFKSVYIGGAQFVRERVMSRMFNPWTLPEIQSVVIKKDVSGLR